MLSIRVLRERTDKSQETVAKEAGLSREAVAAIEQGREKNPRLETLRAIIRVCGATMSDLFPGESEMRYEDSEGDGEHVEIYRKLRLVLGKSQRRERVLLAVVNELYREVKSTRR